MFQSVGTLKYEKIEGYGFRLVLEIDPGIALFYRSLIPKWYKASSLRARPHITVVRKIAPKNLNLWGKYEGEKVEFWYDPDIKTDGVTYWWLNAYSKRLEEIALELGVCFRHKGKPPEGFDTIWHTTIANMK